MMTSLIGDYNNYYIIKIESVHTQLIIVVDILKSVTAKDLDWNPQNSLQWHGDICTNLEIFSSKGA
jgi:hypothetical protein